MKRSRMYWWQDQTQGWIIALLILVLSACQGQSIPDPLIDTWVTDNPKYEDCFLKITPVHIIFGDPEKNSKEYDITKVSTSKNDQTVMVTIEYVNTEKASFSVDLLYSSEDGGYLSFKNQPGVVWKRLK